MHSYRVDLAKPDIERDLGVQVRFDYDTYEQLLDEINGLPDLEGELTSPFNVQLGSRRSHAASIKDEVLDSGLSTRVLMERATERDPSLMVTCPSNVDKANRNLIRATRRHFEDHLGNHPNAAPRILYTSGPALLGGAATGLFLENPLLLASGPAIFLGSIYYHGIRFAPSERIARRYAKEPEIIAKYGQIITYHS